MFESIEDVLKRLEGELYVSDRALATSIFLSHKLKKPIFLEGEAGVGKTEVAKVMSRIMRTKLIRLQCYEGLDANTALYEWNYSKQLLRIRLEEASKVSRDDIGRAIFSEEFLIKRPLLEAIQSSGDNPPVLLIDEIDRSDEEFEAFLLEVLSDFQITIPEIGTIKAKHHPTVILTSNRTREIHDALKRRCLYMWIPYPSYEKEFHIVTLKVPEIREALANQVCQFMQIVRNIEFYKRPGIAETLDWARALLHMNCDDLEPEVVEETLGCIFKYQEDITKIKDEGIESLLNRIDAGRSIVAG
ncbi:MAG: MoxR family ATPase [Candidatus Tectomicrobia bacterium]|nr:MoxR family ATPase [Candidatus Tectomicrobia bacterium]